MNAVCSNLLENCERSHSQGWLYLGWISSCFFISIVTLWNTLSQTPHHLLIVCFPAVKLFTSLNYCLVQSLFNILATQKLFFFEKFMTIQYGNFKVQMLGWQRQKQRKRKSFAAWAWSESSCRIRKFELQWWWWFPIWLRHWLISRISSAAPTSILQILPVLHFFGTFANLWKPLCTIVSLCIFSHTFVNILLHWSAYHGAGSLAILVFLHSYLCPNRKVKKMSSVDLIAVTFFDNDDERKIFTK